jgi:glycosyltransferase involved in cell wall biosynthesis
MPQVSVIIPVFNSARLIGTALRSVFAQTFRDFEVIVVDDGSEDTGELTSALAEWADRIHYVRQANGGPASARNTGISRAAGDLIAFLDADDEWLSDKLERQVGYFARHPETGLLHTALVGDFTPSRATPGPPRHAFCDLFHTEFFVNTLTVMVPRQVLSAVGGFDERREVHIEDWDLWLRIAASYPLGFLAEPLALYRTGGWMSSQVERTYVAQALVIEKNKDLCSRACDRYRLDPGSCERNRRHVLYRDWGYDRLAAGNRSGAREHLGRALTHSPLQPRTAALYVSTFVPDRWRARSRSVLNERRSGAPPPTRATFPSLVHDTIYRRFRRRTISRLHDLDDAISRTGRSRKRVLFDAASPMSLAIFRSVYDRLRRDQRLELWFTAHGRVWQPQEVYGPAGIAENVVPASHAAWMKVDLYVNADFWDMTWLHRRTRRIHLFHGVAGKYGLDTPVDLAPTIAAFDCLMFANTDRRSRYVEAGLVPDDDVKAALIGYPKVDSLVDGSLDRRRIAGDLGLDPRLPTVLYAPTWSPYSSLNGMGEQVITSLAASGLQVIVKLHDRSYDRRERGSGGIDWAQRLAKFDAHPLVRVAHGGDSSPFLAASDVMVSDHSSVAFEYMLLDRPIVLLDRPELVQQAGINPEKVRLLRSAARVVESPTALASEVHWALDNPTALSGERRSIAAQLFYKAGSATDRAVALIYRLIDLPAAANTRAGSTDDRIAPESHDALPAAG